MKYTLLAIALLATSCVGPVTGTKYTPGVDENGVYLDLDNPEIEGHTKIRKGKDDTYGVEKDINGQVIPIGTIKTKK